MVILLIIMFLSFAALVFVVVMAAVQLCDHLRIKDRIREKMGKLEAIEL